MTERMPCHITDGPQTPEDAAEYWDKVFNRLEKDDPDDQDRNDWIEERDDD